VTTLKRVIADKRRVVVPLAIALVANILVYAFVVYPLSVKSAGSADRAAAAATARRAAERDESLARGLVSGKARADEELAAFYQKVLPADQNAARRITYATLPALARKSSVAYEQSRFTPEERDRSREGSDKAENEAASRLGHLAIRMVLEGDYKNIRSFIYELESAPEFVIIDSITLVDRASNEPQTVTLDLSTYYRSRANGL